jgi:hypothetical protein
MTDICSSPEPIFASTTVPSTPPQFVNAVNLVEYLARQKDTECVVVRRQYEEIARASLCRCFFLYYKVRIIVFRRLVWHLTGHNLSSRGAREPMATRNPKGTPKDRRQHHRETHKQPKIWIIIIIRVRVRVRVRVSLP